MENDDFFLPSANRGWAGLQLVRTNRHRRPELSAVVGQSAHFALALDDCNTSSSAQEKEKRNNLPAGLWEKASIVIIVSKTARADSFFPPNFFYGFFLCSLAGVCV